MKHQPLTPAQLRFGKNIKPRQTRFVLNSDVLDIGIKGDAFILAVDDKTFSPSVVCQKTGNFHFLRIEFLDLVEDDKFKAGDAVEVSEDEDFQHSVDGIYVGDLHEITGFEPKSRHAVCTNKGSCVASFHYCRPRGNTVVLNFEGEKHEIVVDHARELRDHLNSLDLGD